MRRFFYILLTIQMFYGMEKEKDKQQESLETPRVFESIGELISRAIEHYEKAESLYKEALKTSAEKFEGSKYEEAEKHYFQANNLFSAVANNNKKEFPGAATLSREILNRIHEIERVKLAFRKSNYSFSEGLQKSVRRTERAYTNVEAKEDITWYQALQETNIENIKAELAKKAKEAAAREKEATEKALQEASKEKIKEQFKKTKEGTEKEKQKEKKKTVTKEKDSKKDSSDEKK
jgi:hypothetical protein